MSHHGSRVGDRLTTTHEFIYLFTKQPHYYFDLDSIREPASVAVTASKLTQPGYPPRSAAQNLGGGTTPRVDLNGDLAEMKARGVQSHPLGKNPGDVWQFSTASFRDAHFATFPLDLVRRPLLSTCPERICTTCGVPWHRAAQVINGRRLALGPLRARCRHQAWRPGRVLDPFLGAGTVALAAEQHQRHWLGIELNPSYADMAERRLADWRASGGSPEGEKTNT